MAPAQRCLPAAKLAASRQKRNAAEENGVPPAAPQGDPVQSSPKNPPAALGVPEVPAQPGCCRASPAPLLSNALCFLP